MEERLAGIMPADLPEPPWVLKRSPTKKIGNSMFLGGPFLTVIDNAAFLTTLKREVAGGPEGPRAKSGVLFEDLAALKCVLEKKEKA